MDEFEYTVDWAAAQDAADPLADLRGAFEIPAHGDAEQVYLCGNSLGLMPRATRGALAEELDDWSQLAVHAHTKPKGPWLSYHALLREPLAELVGASPQEVVAMNSLTVNLHLMMVSFYRPDGERRAILIEKGAFPSDRHAVTSQIAFHGHDPQHDLIELTPADGETTLSPARIAEVIEREGHRIALVLLPGVQYLTGQAFDLKAIAELSRAQGCMVGFDLAHAAGNLSLALHDSGCDFAVWCSYKYLNAGPGAVAGCFVHERHARTTAPRLAGWWGHREATRFEMRPEFDPASGAEGWQISNPPILSLVPLRVSLEMFRHSGMQRLRAKSRRLTGYLDWLIRTRLDAALEVVTPAERGCQLSLRVKGPRSSGEALFRHLEEHGIVGDWREPDIIRVAPTPMYNRYSDCLRFAQAVERWRAQGR